MYSLRRIKRLSLCFLVFITLIPPMQLHAGKGEGFGLATVGSTLIAGINTAETVTTFMKVGAFVATAPFYTVTLPAIGAGAAFLGGCYLLEKHNLKKEIAQRIKIQQEELLFREKYYPDGTPRMHNGEPVPEPSKDGVPLPMNSDGTMSIFPMAKKSEPKKDDKDGKGGPSGSQDPKDPGAGDVAKALALKKLAQEKHRKPLPASENLRPLKDCNRHNTTEAEALAHCPPAKASNRPEVCSGTASNLQDGVAKARELISSQDQTKIQPNVAKEGTFEGMITGRQYRDENGAIVAGYRIDVDPKKGIHVNTEKYNPITKKIEKTHIDCSTISGQTAMDTLKKYNTLAELERAKQQLQHTKDLASLMRLQSQITKATDPKTNKTRFDFVEQTLAFARRKLKQLTS
jgi:hypothetical protein